MNGYEPTEQDYADYMEHLQMIAAEDEALALIAEDATAWIEAQVDTWMSLKKEGKHAEAEAFMAEVNRLERLYLDSLPEYEEVCQDEADAYAM
jgi:ketosteroid isomerase-like protein